MYLRDRVVFLFAAAICWAGARCLSARAADFDTVSHDDIAFVRIPAGTFLMGTTDAHRAALVQQKAWSKFEECELPAHPVTISRPFLICKCEITQQQWKAVMGKN